MKILVSAILSLVLCIGLPAQTNMRKLADLGWMAGCWQSNDKAKHLLSSELWMRPAGGMMLGAGRTVKDGKAVGFEFMRIEQQEAEIFFIARPKENKEETSFRLAKIGRSEAVFENRDHDFPQRVMYKRVNGKLIGRIEGKSNGKFLAIDYPMTRTNCK